MRTKHLYLLTFEINMLGFFNLYLKDAKNIHNRYTKFLFYRMRPHSAGDSYSSGGQWGHRVQLQLAVDGQHPRSRPYISTDGAYMHRGPYRQEPRCNNGSLCATVCTALSIACKC